MDTQKPSETLVVKALTVFKPIRQKKPKIIAKPITQNFPYFRKKRGYVKLNDSKLLKLQESFLKNKYPMKEDFERIASEIGEKPAKVENWFKQQRRKAVNCGKMAFEKKKVFSEDEQKVLMSVFLHNQSPCESELRQLSGKLNCRTKSIRNWFNYKRKIATKIQIKAQKSNILDVIHEQPIPEPAPSQMATVKPKLPDSNVSLLESLRREKPLESLPEKKGVNMECWALMMNMQMEAMSQYMKNVAANSLLQNFWWNMWSSK